MRDIENAPLCRSAFLMKMSEASAEASVKVGIRFVRAAVRAHAVYGFAPAARAFGNPRLSRMLVRLVLRVLFVLLAFVPITHRMQKSHRRHPFPACAVNLSRDDLFGFVRSGFRAARLPEGLAQRERVTGIGAVGQKRMNRFAQGFRAVVAYQNARL